MDHADELTRYRIEKTHQTLFESDRRLMTSLGQLTLLVAFGFLFQLAGDQRERLELELIGLTLDRATASSILMVLAASVSFRTMAMVTFNDRVEKHYIALLNTASARHEIWPTRFPSILTWAQTLGAEARLLDRLLALFGALVTLALLVSPAVLLTVVLMQEPAAIARLGALIAIVLMLGTAAAFWQWISS